MFVHLITGAVPLGVPGVTVSNGHGTNSLESRRQTVAEMISQIRYLFHRFC